MKIKEIEKDCTIQGTKSPRTHQYHSPSPRSAKQISESLSTIQQKFCTQNKTNKNQEIYILGWVVIWSHTPRVFKPHRLQLFKKKKDFENIWTKSLICKCKSHTAIKKKIKIKLFQFQAIIFTASL